MQLVLGVCLMSGLASQALAAPVTNIWVGTENLGGYGRLEFQFPANGQVTMIDAREVSYGSFTRNGSNITLTFPGRAVYHGVINGNTMSGTGHDDTRTWNFTVYWRERR